MKKEIKKREILYKLSTSYLLSVKMILREMKAIISITMTKGRLRLFLLLS